MSVFKTGDLVITHNDMENVSQVVDKEMDDTGRLVYKVNTKRHFYHEELKPAQHCRRETDAGSSNIKTIIVTGGAGYVGSLLVRKLLQNNYRVICVDNLRFGGASLLDIWNHPQFVLKNIDINDFSEVDKVVDESDCYGIIHLAAIVGDPACKLEPEAAVKTNLDSSVHLIDKAVKANVERFIFASTCSNYGKMNDSNGCVDEDSPLAPVSLYAELKVKVEKYLLDKIEKKDGFCPTCLRFATVYGISPRMRFDLTINEFTKELALGRELLVFGQQFWRPYCHVGDFSRAMLTVLRQPKEKVAYNVFNVGDTRENYTKKMIIDELVKKVTGCRIKYIDKNEDPRDYRVNFEKIKSELGFVISKTVPEGIDEILRSIQLGVVDEPDRQVFYNIPVK